MGRIGTIALVAAVIGGAALTYDTKHKAESAATLVARLKADIERETTALSLLRAEWSVLSQPSRLQALAERYQSHLGLAPTSVDQIVRVDEVPAKPVELQPYDGGLPLGGFAGAGQTMTQ